MNITKQKQIHGYKEQTSGYQWGKAWRRGTRGVRGKFMVQHGEHSQYFIITVNGV